MTHDEAMTSRVGVSEALAELAKHGIDARKQGCRIITIENRLCVRIAMIGRDGMVSGRKVLEWLGY